MAVMTPKLQPKSAAIVCAALLALAASVVSSAIAASSRDTQAGAGQATSENTRLQVFLQRRFRLSSASDVQIGPPRPAPIAGMSVRTVTMHNDAGASGSFVLYVDAGGKTAVLSDVEVGAATPGPLHGLWSRPLRAANQPPGSPAKSVLITDAP